MLTNNYAALADLLFDLGAIKFGAFTLKLDETHPEAPPSPIFLNLRTPDNPKPGPLTPEALKLAADLMYALLHLQGIGFSCLAGVPRAGDPFADSLMSCLYSWPVTQLRLGKTESAERRQVIGIQNGAYEPGDVVLVVDDLITHAGTKLEAIRALEADGLVVQDVIVLVNRQQGGLQQLEAAGYRLYSVFLLSDLLEYYQLTGRITKAKVAEVMSYIKSNQAN